MERLRRAHVLVVGLGGVGAYAAEMICRAGVGRMTIVDADTVQPTNINRQLPALHSTLGQKKAEILASRFRDINPALELRVLPVFLKDENIPELLDDAAYDFVVDAIDTLAPKCHLIAESMKRHIKIVSSMGAGAKSDISQVRFADIWDTYHCGLSKAVRKRLQKMGIKRKLPVVFSTEQADPNAVLLTDDEMKMLVDLAKKHDLFLIGDEAYREFVYAGEPLQSMGQFEDAAENVIVIDTVSKRFSACGARIGCMISRNKELMAQAMKYAQCRLSVPTLDQVAAAALYTVGPDYFAAVREEYKRRRDTVVNKLHEIPGVVCECPRGAFYIMAALPVDDADAFQKWLLEEFEDNGDTVMFAPGEPFYGTPGKGKNEIRIAYVLKQADLERAMDLLAKGIDAYNAR